MIVNRRVKLLVSQRLGEQVGPAPAIRCLDAVLDVLQDPVQFLLLLLIERARVEQWHQRRNVPEGVGAQILGSFTPERPDTVTPMLDQTFEDTLCLLTSLAGRGRMLDRDAHFFFSDDDAAAAWETKDK